MIWFNTPFNFLSFEILDEILFLFLIKLNEINHISFSSHLAFNSLEQAKFLMLETEEEFMLDEIW